MIRIRKTLAFGAALALAAVLGAAGPARAGLAIELIANGHTKIIGSTAADTLTAGGIKFQGFTITETTTTLTPGATQYDLTNTQILVVNTAKKAQTLTILASANTLELPGGPLLVQHTGSVTFAKAGDSFKTQAFASNSDKLFDTTQYSTAPLTFTSTKGSLSYGNTNGAEWFGVTSPFSFTSVNTLTLLAGHRAVASSSASLVQTPEPGTVVMALTGLPLLVVGLRRRRRLSAEC